MQKTALGLLASYWCPEGTPNRMMLNVVVHMQKHMNQIQVSFPKVHSLVEPNAMIKIFLSWVPILITPVSRVNRSLYLFWTDTQSSCFCWMLWRSGALNEHSKVGYWERGLSSFQCITSTTREDPITFEKTVEQCENILKLHSRVSKIWYW